MERKDRLVELIQILRDGRIHLASDLARALAVSERTLYRDMATLGASGIPVKGTPGLGYQLHTPITLPPLNLSLTELAALHLGMAIVGVEGAPRRPRPRRRPCPRGPRLRPPWRAPRCAGG